MFAWLEPEVILGSGAPLGPPLLPNDLRSIRFSRSAPSPLGGRAAPRFVRGARRYITHLLPMCQQLFYDFGKIFSPGPSDGARERASVLSEEVKAWSHPMRIQQRHDNRHVSLPPMDPATLQLSPNLV